MLKLILFITTLASSFQKVVAQDSFHINPIGDYFLIGFLVLHSGLFAGLALGLLGLDVIGLETVMASEDKDAAKYASQILPLRKNGNFLLCTLLLGNVATNSLLSILLADITSGLVGFFISTILIVIFGDIIPQSICSRHGLLVGAKCVPLIKLYMFIFFPFSKPLSLVLDWVLGEEIGTIHSKNELRRLLELHVQVRCLTIGRFYNLP